MLSSSCEGSIQIPELRSLVRSHSILSQFSVMPAATVIDNKRRPRPPIDGSLSALIGYADWQAEHQPSEPLDVFLHPDDHKTVVSISYGEFAKATHRVAHFVRPNRVGQDGDVASMLLNTDTVIYQAMIVGLMRAGMVVCSCATPMRNTTLTYYSSPFQCLRATHPTRYIIS